MPSFTTDWRSNAKRPVWRAANMVKTALMHGHRVIRNAIRHVHGPSRIEYAEDELVVLCIMKNGELWVNSFIQHHMDLGARHIVFLDNGSTDESLALATSYPNVSVWQTDLAYRRFEVPMHRWLKQTFGRNRWSLTCDVDELFDYPHSDRIDLRSFLGYLNHHAYKAVAAHMLDMFSDEPLSRLRSRKEDSLRSKYRFYDTTDIGKRRDVYWIEKSGAINPEIACTFGGIRRRIFGTENLFQTKHPLVFAADEVGINTYDNHFHTRAAVADISGVLLHYKFVSTLFEQAKEAVTQDNHTGRYAEFYEYLNENPDPCLRLDTAQELLSIQNLVDQGFLTVSDEYRAWVAAHKKSERDVPDM